MNKDQKEKINNLYYVPTIQENNIEEEIKEEKKKKKEREKRIKNRKKVEKKELDKFDIETETVIGMTNKNNKKNQETRKKVIDKNERKRKKKIKRIKRILKITTLLIIVIGGTTFALVSPIFNIQEINVINSEKVSGNEIISLSGISKNQNIFRFLSSKSIEQIKTNPYIEEAQIKRIFPNKVEITVKERKATFNVEFLNEYAYINNQGFILEISNEKLDLPTIQGIKTKEEDIKAGNRLNNDDLEKLEIVIQIVDSYKSANLENQITSIDIENKNEYTVYMEEAKKIVYLGDGTNLGDKILWLQAILKDNEGIEGEIYLDGDLNENFKPRFKEKVSV